MSTKSSDADEKPLRIDASPFFRLMRVVSLTATPFPGALPLLLACLALFPGRMPCLPGLFSGQPDWR